MGVGAFGNRIKRLSRDGEGGGGATSTVLIESFYFLKFFGFHSIGSSDIDKAPTEPTARRPPNVQDTKILLWVLVDWVPVFWVWVWVWVWLL